MSGHSKWATIHRAKGVADAKRSSVFTKMSRLISVAVKEGGGIGDPGMNFKLRLAVEKARSVNMPKANIERAITQGLGKAGGEGFQTAIYEGYGPNGIAVMVEAVTDNMQRTFSEVRQIFDRNGGTLGQPGSVGFLFDQVGELVVDVEDSDTAMLEVMDLEGVVDVEEDDGSIVVYSDPKAFKVVQDGLEEKGFKVKEGTLVMKPKDGMSLDEEDVEKVAEFIDKLEDNDDVQRVFVNVEI